MMCNKASAGKFFNKIKNGMMRLWIRIWTIKNNEKNCPNGIQLLKYLPTSETRFQKFFWNLKSSSSMFLLIWSSEQFKGSK